MAIELTVREEAEQLLARYAELIDAADFDGLADLLADAVLVTDDGTVIATGREEIRELYASTNRVHPDGTLRTQHVITNVIVEALDGERVGVRARFTVLQATDALALQPIVAGRYDDVMARVGGRWRIVVHGMVPTLWGDIGAHLTIDPRPPPGVGRAQPSRDRS